MDIATFSELLVIKKHQLDEELVVHSDVLFRISEEVVRLHGVVARCADDLKQAEAEAFNAQKMMLIDGKPPSDTRAEMGVRTDPFRVKAHTLLMHNKTELERWEGLYAAWKDKGYNMSTLAEMYRSGNFAVTLPNRTVTKRDYTTEAAAPAPASPGRRRARSE